MEPELDFVADKKIVWSKKKKDGENQWGKWELWNFKVEGDERYFSYFKKEKDSAPVKGAFVKMMKFPETKNDFNNYDVQELFLSSGKSKEKPPQNASEPQKSTKTKNEYHDIGPMSMWGKYIGAIIEAFINDGLSGEELDQKSKEAMETFVDCCIVFEKTYTSAIVLPKPNTKPVKIPEETKVDETGYEIPPIEAYDNDDIPF